MIVQAARERNENLGIGDVSKLCGVPVHTVRYWEDEFQQFLQPSRTEGKQRRYTDDDIRKVLRIKELLWTQRFSIRAAKRILAAGAIGATQQNSRFINTIDTGRLLMRMAQFNGGSLAVSQ